MIHIASLALAIGLGRFHRVISMSSNQNYVSILDQNYLEYLIPVYPPPTQPFTIKGDFHRHLMPKAQSVLHLDHLEIRDVTAVAITPALITIETAQGVNFTWKVFPHDPVRIPQHRKRRLPATA